MKCIMTHFKKIKTFGYNFKKPENDYLIKNR